MFIQDFRNSSGSSTRHSSSSHSSPRRSGSYESRSSGHPLNRGGASSRPSFNRGGRSSGGRLVVEDPEGRGGFKGSYIDVSKFVKKAIITEEGSRIHT